MKRHGGLWEPMLEWENFLLAARKAERGKRDRSYAKRFRFDLEKELWRLREELLDDTYRPGPFSTHWITPVRRGAKFVGFRVWPTHRLLRKDNFRAFRLRVKDMKRHHAAGELDCHDIKTRLVGWLGHAGQASSKRLVERLSRDWTFAGGGADTSRHPGRLVEQ